MKRTKGTALVLTLVSALLLSACSGNEANKNNEATSAASSSPAASSAASTGKTATGKYEPSIEVTTVRDQILNLKYPDGDSIENNVWTRGIEKELGIKIKYDWVGSGDYDQKLSIMLASGEMPDFFKVTDAQLQDLIADDLIADLTDAYENNISETARKYMDEGGELSFKMASKDGKLMAIPFNAGAVEQSPVLWIREDWRKKLNLPEPKTIQDVLAMAKAFTNDDPDQNGKKDTFGFALAAKDMTTFKQFATGFLNSYHAYVDTWVKTSDGKLVYSNTLPEMKTALESLGQLFGSGEMDKEFVVKDYVQGNDPIIQGKAGIFYGFFYSGGFPLQNLISADPKSEWKSYPILSADDQPARPQGGANAIAYWVVNKKAEHPEAIVKLLNFWMEKFYTKDDATFAEYNTSADGSGIWQNTPIQSNRAFKNLDGHLNLSAVLKGTKPESELTPEEKTNLTSVKKYLDGDVSFYWVNQIFGENGSLQVIDTYKQNDLGFNNAFYGPLTETMKNRSASLEKLSLETFTKMIMGSAKAGDFDTYVANWNKGGGEQMTKEVNEWYAANQ
ncbi:extracellular solute-binding protein [Cohnella sp. GCM10012308]|uniref:extracellular solute-binding protein n=1 Tax=Cohnella sp. GCM10012308 TaxID=3317329 RepID=UPI00361DF38C